MHVAALLTLASHAGVFRGARISSLPTRREEIRASLKMPAWEAILTLKANWFDTVTLKQWEIMINNDVFMNQHSNETAHWRYIDSLLKIVVFFGLKDRA